MRPLIQKQLLALVLLAGVNLVLDAYTGGYDPRFGLEVIRTSEMRWAKRRLFLLGMPLVGLLVGAVAAVVPDPRTSYGQRLLPRALWVAIALEGAYVLQALFHALSLSA